MLFERRIEAGVKRARTHHTLRSCRGLHGTGVERGSVVNDPLGQPGRTPLYVGLPSAWGSVEGDLMFFPICRRARFWGSPADIHE